ncbi:Metal dependent phosphohydrolase [Candidatus Accumulibacter aalborgensis]|uniref:Metal dependent phosphohydrolase n=1 Tax=Candidatus Accumulibacter aalborgensis TaxID=1860102 RepID=A0A1A8XMK4_9PROT|nr:HD domain-containing phosphohydrolase [Candidatus Accumulibacter aalborgensis]SBT06404.1 Metal dependent phosphohydrolase [Candidatus Accumulibacter aalborgensis]
MHRQTIAAQVIPDGDALQEFIDALRDYVPSMERNIAQLRSSPDNKELINSLFRTLHNVKGDAAMCRVDLAVAIVHPLETVLDRVRHGSLPFTDQLADVVLLTIDRLELAVASVSSGEELDGLALLPLVNGLERLALAGPANLDDSAAQLIEAVTGFRSASALSVRIVDLASPASARSTAQTDDDLFFFRTLADRLDARSPRFQGRTMRVLRLALETNQIAGYPIDPVQLEAAVCMHDVGMMFLAESTWLKAGALTRAEKAGLRAHPTYAAGLLARMPGWSEAAEMVAQHHEMPDGKGYPAALAAAGICPGAKLLSIIDAFDAIMLRHGEHGRNRSILRAIAEINACDKQFAPQWIECFNRVIRRSVEAR